MNKKNWKKSIKKQDLALMGNHRAPFRHHPESQIIQVVNLNVCKNIFKKILFTALKIQAKTLSRSCVFVQGEPKNYTSSNDERLKHFRHNMSMVIDTRKTSFGSQ